MQATFSVTERGSAVQINLAGFATLRAQPAQLATLRKNPGLGEDAPLPAGFLKNSDDQTVLALAAIGQAMHSLGRPLASYNEWGVLAAPNLLGRLCTMQSLLSFRKDGAWGISPHLIPHNSLHAVSGTISQALHLHGPNFGVSGGPKAVTEAFLAAATMVSENNLPGLWVVLSGHESECIPGAEHPVHPSPTGCLAAALALEHGSSPKTPLQLVVSGAEDTDAAEWPEFTLGGFVEALEAPGPDKRWSLPGGGWVILESASSEELP